MRQTAVLRQDRSGWKGAGSLLTVLHVQMHDGLEKANSSSILMLPTHVLRLPTG